MSKQKESYLEMMTPFKSFTSVIDGVEHTADFLTYKPEPKNCAIKINNEVYGEFSSFDKAIGQYEVICSAMEIMGR